jgi:predicted DNA-binding transcriptional regulator AlpA
VPPEVTQVGDIVDQIIDGLAARLRTDQERLLTLPELAERVGLSVRGVTGLIARKELPEGYLIGGARRWSWPELQKWLQARQSRKPRHRRRGQYDRSKTDSTTPD